MSCLLEPLITQRNYPSPDRERSFSAHLSLCYWCVKWGGFLPFPLVVKSLHQESKPVSSSMGLLGTSWDDIFSHRHLQYSFLCIIASRHCYPVLFPLRTCWSGCAGKCWLLGAFGKCLGSLEGDVHYLYQDLLLPSAGHDVPCRRVAPIAAQ